jgi:hypothetical protein
MGQPFDLLGLTRLNCGAQLWDQVVRLRKIKLNHFTKLFRSVAAYRAQTLQIDRAFWLF